MSRPHLIGTPALWLAALLGCLSAAPVFAQTETSSAANRKALRLELAIKSLEARVAGKHALQNQTEEQAHAAVTRFSKALAYGLTATTAKGLFSRSQNLLKLRVTDLQAALQVWSVDAFPSRPLRGLSKTASFQDQLDVIDASARQSDHDLMLGSYRDVHFLMDARAVILDFLPVDDRSLYLSWSEDTRDVLALEGQTVVAMTKAHAHRVLFRLSHLKVLWSEVGGIRVVGMSVLYLVLLLFGLIWLRRQVPKALLKLREYEYHQARTVKRLRQTERLITLISNFGIISINILGVHAFAYLLSGRLNYIEIKVGFAIAFWTVYYRLAQRIVEVLIYRTARRRFGVSRQTRQHITNSIFFAGRIVLSGGLLLSVIHAVTNFGMVYYWSRKLVLVAMLLGSLILLNRWRPSIIAIYLEKGPKGVLSNWVEKAKDKPYGFILVCVAFLYLAAHGTLVLLRDTILGFEQSRKALAFLFRRRLEKHAEEVGHWEEQINSLPEALRSAFTLEPLTDPTLRVDRFPGLEDFQSQYERWLNYKTKGAFLLVGPLGYGKTTWLHRAMETDGLEYLWISLRRSKEEVSTLSEHLSELYEPKGDTFEDLVEAVLDGPRGVLVLDDCHNLVTRSIGGCGVFEDLMRLIEATGHHVFWLCSMDSLNWKFVQTSRPQRPWFREVVKLPAWDDTEITQLIMARAVVSGVVHRFEDLVTEEHEDKSTRRLAEVSESYARLIWDSSDGCPWVALHYWLRSLAPVNERQVRVRLFRRHNLTRLERWPKEAIFLYAALALHNRLSASEVARILRYSKSLCETFLNQGCEEGYLLCDENGRYHLNVSWYRPIIRYLSQRHAVEDV